MRILLNGGGEVHPRFTNGMWRADVEAYHFCSQTKEGLIRALACRYSFSVHYEKAHVPELRGAEKHLHTLRNSHSLEEKQAARRDLKQYGYEHLFVRELSAAAKQIAEKLNKEFLDMTVQELTQHVNDIVLRNRLITELAEGHNI